MERVNGQSALAAVRADGHGEGDLEVLGVTGRGLGLLNGVGAFGEAADSDLTKGLLCSLAVG